MARGRSRLTSKGSFSSDQMKEAVELVRKENYSCRQAAAVKGLSHQTLARYLKKVADRDISGLILAPKYRCRQVFTDTQEDSLASYLKRSSAMGFGLTTHKCRLLAYEMALRNQIPVPPQWTKDRIAGREWFFGFKKRHPDLVLRTGEGCSLGRATSFDRHHVKIFFDQLEKVLQRDTSFLDGTSVYNLDETSATTVPTSSPKVLAEKGVKQVNQITSGKRGTLVTTTCIVSAMGVVVPPVMVSPRVVFKPHMLAGCFPGTLGLANKSGWMTSELFPQVIKHFVKHTGTSKENKSLLLLDNHDSHLAIEVLDLAKENGVVILTFPPHTTHKMQPCDVSLMGPFKKYYSAVIYDSVRAHIYCRRIL